MRVNIDSASSMAPDAPRSLFGPRHAGSADADPARYLSREESEALFKRIVAFTRGGGETQVRVESWWTGNLRWARNRITTAGDTTDRTVGIWRRVDKLLAWVETNKFDDASLRQAVALAEERATFLGAGELNSGGPLPRAQQYLQPALWSDATYNVDAQARSTIARGLVQPAIEAKLLAAGYAEVRAESRAIFNTEGLAAYYAATRGEYSVTVRNPAGTGSGWAGVAASDWTTIDTARISAVAQQKCVDSADPRAIEPGRYTVILEPQAVHDLLFPAIESLDRSMAEAMVGHVYNLRAGQSKIGLKVFDDRLTISTDPMDPEGGYVPFDGFGNPYSRVVWVEGGVLRELAYDAFYALRNLRRTLPLPNPLAYRVEGIGTIVPVDEMIASTKRGLLVTRLSGAETIHRGSLLATGVSRDGLWLIENGKIKYPIKNMRFTESPMFAFNSVDQIGPSIPVYSEEPAIVPWMKVRDFNFSSLADAV